MLISWFCQKTFNCRCHADGILFVFLYLCLYEWRFGLWPGVSPRLVIAFVSLVLISYVAGRYVSGADNYRAQHARFLANI